MSVVLHGRSHPAQGSRVRGSQGPYGFKGTKNLRVSGSRRIEGLPRLTGTFKGMVFPNSYSLRAHGIEDFRVSKAQGLEGEKAPRFP